jgi:hypothetical protein
MIENWNHLPHWLRAIILGNLIQGAFVALLRLLMGRFTWLEPMVQRLGPKALRGARARRAGEGFAVAVVWFALSWYVGRKAMAVQGAVVAWALRR